MADTVFNIPKAMAGATVSSAGTHGLVPAPSAGDQDKFLKGDGTWETISSGDTLPSVTSSDNGKVLEVVNGEWDVGEKKIDKKYELDFGSIWSVKEWTGLTNFYGPHVWSDGENIYYSNGSYQYVLNKSTSTWSSKQWTGLTSFYGPQVWTDGENVYYSSSSDQYVLNKSTLTWSTKEWSGLTSFFGNYTWTDGENIYYSYDSNHYVLDKTTSTWNSKSWSGLTEFRGDYIWTDCENTYYSEGNNQYVLNKSTSTWATKTWSGFTNIYASYIWTDGENVYLNDTAPNSYVLNKLTSTWSTKEWTELTNFDGTYIWSDGNNIYYSYNSNHYVLNRDNSRNKLLFGSNGEFTVVDVNTVIPDISNKADLIDGKVPSYQLPSYIDEKIDKKYKLSFMSNWSVKEWTGLTNYAGYFIWSDGDNIYYSNNNNQYVLDKSTSTWSTKVWNGLPNYSGFIAAAIWTDGENIYYSPGSNHYVLNKSTSTWSTKVWYGLTGFHGSNIWSDGDNIYNSSGSTQNILDKSTSTWSDKTWSGLTSFTGNNIWSDGDNIYYSYSSSQYVLNKSTSTWSAKEWTGLTSFSAGDIWTDGENIYYNSSYILDTATSTWSTKTWTGISGVGGINVWTDGENIYYSNGTTQYTLDKDNSSKLLLGTNGQFNTVSADEVIPSVMTGATSSVNGTSGLVPAPTTTDVDKFLAGDGTFKSGGKPMVILSYGNSTWQDFINAYNSNVIVYCRASSNSNPATGSQTRMAFMAYVNNATTPTEVEFQYYRSVSSKSQNQQGDQVFVYKLTSSGGGTWTVATRECMAKIVAGTGMTASYNSGTLTLNNKIPEASSTDGTYILQCVVSSGTPTYSWVSLPNASGVSF